jgi:group I intron endonuclease
MIGIYKIICLLNNSIYIGSSVNLEQRFYNHLFYLRCNKHHNKHLQNAYNLYGEENFKFEIIEECEKEILIEREQFHIDELKPKFNLRLIAKSNLGMKHSEETKEKMSESHKGQTSWCKGLTKENNKSLLLKSLKYKGRIPWNKNKKCGPLTKEHIEKLSGINSPKSKFSLEQVKEIREKYKTNKYSYSDLAKEYGVSKTCINNIIKNRRYKEIIK